MRPPAFWSTEEARGSAALTRALLAPLGAVYAALAARRIARTEPERIEAPVICVGNLTLGGTGKTPVAIAILNRLTALGHAPAALTRGYGGRERGPVAVRPDHTACEVGDEALLLARAAPVIVSRDRPAGARLALQRGADAVVMDDGHQNPTLYKDLSLVVIDAEAGWGAKRVFPAGPLREPVAAGLDRADAVIAMTAGPDAFVDYARLGLDGLEIPVLRAWLEPAEAPPQGPLLAFAGIGRPQKFFDALAAAGGEIADTASFPDHHAFTVAEAERLIDLAEAWSATPVTTEKDWVRLPEAARARVTPWPVRAVFAQPERLDAIIEAPFEARDAMDAARRRG